MARSGLISCTGIQRSLKSRASPLCKLRMQMKLVAMLQKLEERGFPLVLGSQSQKSSATTQFTITINIHYYSTLYYSRNSCPRRDSLFQSLKKTYLYKQETFQLNLGVNKFFQEQTTQLDYLFFKIHSESQPSQCPPSLNQIKNHAKSRPAPFLSL